MKINTLFRIRRLDIDRLPFNFDILHRREHVRCVLLGHLHKGVLIIEVNRPHQLAGDIRLARNRA